MVVILKIQKPVEILILAYKLLFFSKYLNSISWPSPFKLEYMSSSDIYSQKFQLVEKQRVSVVPPDRQLFCLEEKLLSLFLLGSE